MNAAKNPFDPANCADLFKVDVSKMFDMTKMFDGSAMNGVDAQALMSVHQKNVEALIAAQQAASKGYQELFEKQVAIYEKAVTDIQAHVGELSKSGSVSGAAETQTELLKSAYETAMANLDELNGIAQKANNDAFSIVKARIEASMKEIAPK